MLIQEKVEQAVGILREHNIDCWITFARESAINGDPALDYLIGADITWHTAVIITSTGESCVICGEYDRKTIEDTGAYRQVIGFVKGIRDPFLEVVRRMNPSSIAVNYSRDSEICDGITHGMYLTLMSLLGELGFENRVVSAEGIVSALRQRKTGTELALVRQAIKNTEDIFAKVTKFISPGRTEQEIAAFMKSEVDRMGLEFAWEPGHCPAVFTGPDTAGAHYGPTDRRVEPGHILNMDFGVKYQGYCSDLQRTFYILDKGESGPPPEVLKGFGTIVDAIEQSRAAMKPGVLGIEIDAIARGRVTAAGYAEFPHALGHQVGRFAHDGTALLGPAWEKYARKPFARLEPGMVFTIEPRLTVPGRGVATIEEMVLVTSSGAEYLSTPQDELILIRS
ncbi:MAG: Xaa-Pro peptidase family protein [Acidobacteriia bacterium]|nr:Xaa-Pro peptidase family protein [Terriglobia bacterium]